MIDCQARVGNTTGSLETLLSEMTTARVSRAVLFGADASVSPGVLAEIRDRHAGRFAVVGRLDPRSAASVSDCERLCAGGRLDGVEMCPEGDSGARWVNLPEVMAVWQRLEHLRVPVNICIASQEYNQFSDVVTSFPRLVIVLDDLGKGPGTDMSQFLPVMLEYARYPRVVVSISGVFRISKEGHPHRELWPAICRIFEEFGPARLVWGSGYPDVQSACGYEAEAGLLKQLPFLKPVDIEAIAERTPSRLWFEPHA